MSEVETDFNPNEVDYAGVEPSGDTEFRNVKPGTYTLVIEDLKFEKNKDRGVLTCRYSLAEGQNVELILEEGDEDINSESLSAGSIFDRFWFHTPKALPMFANWLEKMGLSWDEYKEAGDKAAYVETLKGRHFQAILALETYNDKTSTKVKKYLKD